MKNFNPIVVAAIAILTVAVFTSCQKRDGVFNPNKKISTISSSQDGYPKTLSETWKWDKNLLTAIDYQDGETFTFTYNKKDQLISAQSSNATLQVTYDSKEIFVETMEFKEDDYIVTYKFSHNDDNLIESYKVTITGADAKSQTMRLIENSFRFILPEIAQAEAKQYHACAANNTKGVQEYTVTLTYDKDKNVTGIVTTNFEGKSTTTYTYTEYLNPFHGSLFNIADETNAFSVNLPATSKTTFDVSSQVIDATYTYVVDGKFPTETTYKKTTTYSTGSLAQSITNTTIYYYEYVE